MPSKSSPMPFPFLPVVLTPSSPAKAAQRDPTSDGPARASGAGGRAAARHGAERMTPPPALDEVGMRAFRVEVERRTASEGLTLLGAIVR
ncbi:hypothetical protein PMO31116_04553 [Pandoraea morbifera]|uniref:Uncharacterized protein n=1 Tax=Pandoraea morbifera TaxID=2508300 RepID=A0A5E4YLC8_9BURK|nr:hypothetical protein [Pandoraea morbifera]VVE49337.1 hypothetical protein PMO31116_04553 [Pandoraea morbifera]